MCVRFSSDKVFHGFRSLFLDDFFSTLYGGFFHVSIILINDFLNLKLFFLFLVVLNLSFMMCLNIFLFFFINDIKEFLNHMLHKFFFNFSKFECSLNSSILYCLISFKVVRPSDGLFSSFC